MVLQPSFLILCSVGIGQPLDLSLLGVPTAKIPWCLSWIISSGLVKRLSKKRFAYPFPDPPLGAAPHSCFHQTDKEAEHSRVALLHLFPVGLQNHIHSSKYLQGSISYTLILQTTLACTFWVYGGPWMASSFRRWPSIFLEWQYCWALFWNDLLAVVSCAICYDRPDLLQSFSYCHWNVI